MARRSFAHLQFVHQLQPSLDQNSLCSVTQALVVSCLDYCNALYLGLPLKCIQKLQLVQSAEARTLLGVHRMACVTSLLHKLYWLPVWFYVLVMPFKALHGIVQVT